MQQLLRHNVLFNTLIFFNFDLLILQMQTIWKHCIYASAITLQSPSLLILFYAQRCNIIWNFTPWTFQTFFILKSWSSKIEFEIRTPHATRFSVQRASSLPSRRKETHCHSSLDSIIASALAWCGLYWKALCSSYYFSLFIFHMWFQSNFAWNLSSNKFYISHTYIPYIHMFTPHFFGLDI